MIAQHQKVENYLVSLIQKGNAGDLLPSQSELCSKFDVSNITVRRALDDIEQKGLILRKKGKGTFIKKLKTSNDAIKVFMIIPARISLDDKFISGIFSQSMKSRTNLYIYHYDDSVFELEKAVSANTPDGILWVAPDDRRSIQTAEMFRLKNYAVMIFNRVIKNSHLSYVSSNNSGGVKELVEHFISSGCRRIAFFGHDRNIAFSHARFAAFQQTLKQYSLYDPKMVIDVCLKTYDPGDLNLKAEALLNNSRPDAVLCSQGAFLPDLLEVTRAKKLDIPNDLKIGTYNLLSDDIPEKKDILQIDQAITQLGKTALRELELIIKGKNGKVRQQFEPRILRGNKIITNKLTSTLTANYTL